MKKWKKLLALILAAGMTLTLAACAATGTAVPAAPQGESAAVEPDFEDGPLVPYPEPVTITWGVADSHVMQFYNGDTWDDNVWSRLIKEKLNIELKVAFTADSATDAYRNKLNTLLASGELPDIISHSDYTYFRQAVDAGYIADIGDVFEKYATDAVKEYRVLYPDSFDGVTVDGKLYGFPHMDDHFHQAAFLWIRDDWLENLGAERPQTVEEMVELARRFTFEDPDGNGVDDTYGFGLQANVVTNNVGTLMGLAGAFGVPGYGANAVFYRDENNEMTFAWIQPGMKECLALVHQMYEEGLIDPEFMAADTSVMEADITSGKIGMMYQMNWGTWHPFNYSYMDSGVITRPYPIPTEEGYDPKMGILSNQNNSYYLINSSCEHPEAVIKILNLFEQTCISFTDPQDFQTYWVNEQSRYCPITVRIPTELYAPIIHEALEKGSSEGLAGQALQYYEIIKGFEDGSLAGDHTAYGTWGQMYLDGEGGSMKIALDYKDKGWLVENVMGADEPEVWQQSSSILSDMIQTTFVDIIVGNKPVDYFDEFVEQWLANGGQATLDALEEMYPAE